jgi:predicted AAA+ superfamily ATPase
MFYFLQTLLFSLTVFYYGHLRDTKSGDFAELGENSNKDQAEQLLQTVVRRCSNLIQFASIQNEFM